MHPDSAMDGETALAKLLAAQGQGKPYGLMLLDIKMPQLDGFAVARRIHNQAEYGAPAILVLTAYGEQGQAAHCRTLGITGYLTKPISNTELKQAIQTVMGRDPHASTGLVTRHVLSEMKPRLRVLLAEDNPVNQVLAIALLEKQGHQVHIANHGREALAALATQTFDLLLMDMQMPEMDGLEATRRIREQEQTQGGHLPIIAMTANAMTGDRERCLESGMDDYVSKPIKAELLFNTIDQVLARFPLSAPALAQTPDESSAPMPPVTPVTQTDETGLFDVRDALSRLDDDLSLLRQIGEMFLENWPGNRERLRQALIDHDQATLHREAHTLKGLLATFSAKQALPKAAAFEHKVKNALTDNTPRELEQLVVEVEMFLARLKQFVSMK